RGAVRLDADRARRRRRIGAAAAARRGAGRRPPGLAMADALYDAGHLSLSRTVVALAWPRAPAIAAGPGHGPGAGDIGGGFPWRCRVTPCRSQSCSGGAKSL